MTLPKKNRRNIVLDDSCYHWVFDASRLSGNDSYIVVQSATGKGPKLLLQWVGLALPRFVAEAIRFAVQHGWGPDGHKLLEIGCDSFASPTEFYLCPQDAERYWFHDWWHQHNPGHLSSTPLADYGLEHWK